MAGTGNGANRARGLAWYLSRLALLVGIVGSIVSVVTTQNSIAEKQTELQQIQNQIDNLTTENEDLRRILGSGDLNAYMEELARDEYNYAYPDEYRFYDTSHG